MKMTKYMITVFAVFASILMLMTPTMARPVAEKTTMDIVETTEQELINSLEILSVRLSRDIKVNKLICSLTCDPVVARAIEQFEQVETEEEMSMALEQLVVSIEGKSELTQLGNLIEQEYTAEAEAISEQLEILVDDGDGDVQSSGNFNLRTIVYIIFLIILSYIGEILIGYIISIICALIAGMLYWLYLWLNGLFGDGDGGTPSM